MSSVFRKWYERRFHDEEAILLLIIISIGVALILFVGEIFTPVIAALVLAFLLLVLIPNKLLGKVPLIPCPCKSRRLVWFESSQTIPAQKHSCSELNHRVASTEASKKRKKK